MRIYLHIFSSFVMVSLSNKHEDWAAYCSARNEVNNKLELAHSSYCRRMFDDSFLAIADSFESTSKPNAKIHQEFFLYL